eukprot:981813-Lingulodinium_polyedra.AAC.1
MSSRYSVPCVEVARLQKRTPTAYASRIVTRWPARPSRPWQTPPCHCAAAPTHAPQTPML